MRCPNCQSEEIKVLESRDTENGFVIRRRRECVKCKNRFTTFERIENINFFVVKKDGVRDLYNRQKLIRGIQIACAKRKISQEEIDKFINKLEQKWIASNKKEIHSKEIGYDIMENLKKLDKVAYIRFASVYRNFEDINNFQDELSSF
jgi:transcriptional repressor NrdR